MRGKSAYSLTTLWVVVVVAASPVVATQQVCYNSFGTIVCHNQLSYNAHAAIWASGIGVLLLIFLTVFLVRRHRASRARDAIATVEASQVEGPLPTPFGSSFVQVPQGQPVTYPAMAYGPRTAAAPQSALSVGFTPGLPQRERAPYSSSHYPLTAELSALAPSARGLRTGGGAGLPESPRRSASRREAVITPRDKNTRFIIPETAERTGRTDWSERAEAMRTAPIRRDGFEQITGEPPSQVKSASVVGRLKPLFTTTQRI